MSFYLSAFRGLGVVAQQELTERFGLAVTNCSTKHTPDLDLLQFDYTGEVSKLKQVGTAEDVYYLLDSIALSGDRTDLDKLRQAVTHLLALQVALAAHKQLRQTKPKGKTSYRVVAQATDAEWRQYRRVDMQRAVERGLGEKYPKWRLVADDADLEFWLQQTNKRVILGLRLTDRTQRHRTYKQANLPGSLRPTIAYALAYLTGPEPDDIFLDPLCGAGTVLIERARAGRYQKLLGGDIRPEAVSATLANLGKQHKPWEVKVWDARSLPLPDKSVSKVATNLPWGRQVGSAKENQELYGTFLQEACRVLTPQGRVVALTSQWELFKESLGGTGLSIERHLSDISVLGWHADIFVLRPARS